MEKILDYKVLSREIMACMRPGLVTNCTLSGEQLREKIGLGTLYRHRYDGGLLLLEKKQQGNLLRFYLTDPSVLPQVELPAPLVCECVLRPGQTDAFAPWLEAMGFSLVLRRIRMGRQSAEADDAALSAALDGKQVRAVLEECFSEDVGCIPSEKELSLAASEGRVLTKMENGKICAVLHAERRKGYVELRHLAVLPACRKKGYASELTARFGRIFGAEPLRVWVREDNAPAQHIYEENGFLADGYTATVWKKKGQ